MNARANALGLGACLSVAIGIAIVCFKDVNAVVGGSVIGVGCSLLYIVGMLVGRADAREKEFRPRTSEAPFDVTKTIEEMMKYPEEYQGMYVVGWNSALRDMRARFEESQRTGNPLPSEKK